MTYKVSPDTHMKKSAVTYLFMCLSGFLPLEDAYTQAIDIDFYKL